jgi:hypothetical protein
VTYILTKRLTTYIDFVVEILSDDSQEKHIPANISYIPGGSTPRIGSKKMKNCARIEKMTYMFPHVDAEDRLVCYAA